MVTKFEENFWGDGNHGFEVLLQNMKSGPTASKELADYLKDRISVEDSYCKGLAKVQKSVLHVSAVNLGGFAPLWEVITEMSNHLADSHGQFVKLLGEVNKEILEYHNSQKDKMKSNLKGEIELAQEALSAFQSTEGAIDRTKKQYQQSIDHLAKAVAKHNKAAADPSLNSKAESRVNQAKSWMETMKADHQAATKRHCEQLMDFQVKMKEACQKFESIEEEHLAQMSTFMIKIAKTQDTHHLRSERVFAKVNEQLDIFSVEKLLAEFVTSRGTGRDKPVPYKFRTLELPTVTNLSVSTEDVRAGSPTAGTRTSSKGERGLKNLLRKKKKSSTQNTAPTDGGSTIPEASYEVDEEGYSLRPEHASNIGMFPGEDQTNKQDSDFYSSDEDDQESKIRHIKIRDRSMGQPQASVDDIKASVMSLRIGGGSPGMRKAGSSQSLNMLSTPPSNRRNHSTANISQGPQASVASLMDVDLMLSGTSATGIPSPLTPESSALPPPLLAPDPTSLPPPLLVPEPTSLPPPLLAPDPTETLKPWTVGVASLDDPTQSLAPQPAQPDPPTTASEPTLPKILVPSVDQDTGPQNTITLTARESDSDKPQLGKSKVPLINPPPKRSNTTPPKRNTSSSEVRVVSPLAVNARSASASPTPVGSRPSVIIPLAVAFRETANAIFHGTDVSKCVSKVTGEVVMSFPSNYLGEIAKSEGLLFKLSQSERIERVLHNQQLLKKSDSDQPQYVFDMPALMAQLKMMKEKHSSPFYNVQLLKYEVKVADSANLPVKLVSYWKCEPSVTNFRLDYTYQPAALTFPTSPKPLTGFSVSVPVDGGVRNALSKPNGSWDAESKTMVWDMKTIEPATEPITTSLHAKFDVGAGPSTASQAVLKFDCEGASVSGLGIELGSVGYKVSLRKLTLSSGKYIAEVS